MFDIHGQRVPRAECTVGSNRKTTDCRPSRVLLACGLSADEALETICFSFGRQQDAGDVDVVVDELAQQIALLNQSVKTAITKSTCGEHVLV